MVSAITLYKVKISTKRRVLEMRNPAWTKIHKDFYFNASVLKLLLTAVCLKTQINF